MMVFRLAGVGRHLIIYYKENLNYYLISSRIIAIMRCNKAIEKPENSAQFHTAVLSVLNLIRFF